MADEQEMAGSSGAGPQSLSAAADSAPPREELKLEIHKPKPMHSWRDFLKEVGTIVLGVSVALAGEQAVEKWRQHRQYLEARDAMRYEIEINYSNSRRRELFEPCLQRRLVDIEGILQRAEARQPFDTPAWIGNPGSLRMRFTAEAEAGKSDLFSAEEQGVYGRFYSYLHTFDIEQDRERLAWARLQMLAGQHSLSPEMIYGLRAALADARFEDERVALMKAWLVTLAGPLNLRDRTAELLVTQPKFWPHCVPMNTPRADAMRLSELIPIYKQNGSQ